MLWGMTSPTVRSDRAALRDYFVTAFKVLPGLKVSFGDQLIRVYGNTAVNTGYYTFSYAKDGETKSLPARYSFTYVKDGERWLIVDHHSSAMPSTPEIGRLEGLRRGAAVLSVVPIYIAPATRQGPSEGRVRLMISRRSIIFLALRSMPLQTRVMFSQRPSRLVVWDC